MGNVAAATPIPTRQFSKNQTGMKTKFLCVLGMILAALAFMNMPAFAADQEADDSELKAMHGAWQVRCGRAPGAQKEKCALIQSVRAEDRPNIHLMVIFIRSYDGKTRLLRVITPLGVLLPHGLGLTIDKDNVGNVKFTKCGKSGCIAEIELDEKLFKRFEKGQKAIFVIFQTLEKGIGIPISLEGFVEGFKELN
jgi:invasion protein IalB